MRTKVQFIRKTALAGLIALCASSIGYAQTATPATGLGQAWPNATDLSASPNWHVYVFVLNGVKYVQVNDLNGTVHAAVAVVSGAVAVLPMGVDSQNVTTASSSTTSTAQTIYNDGTTTVTAAPQSNGTTQFVAAPETQACPTADCSGSSVTSSSGL
jgi:hypothetical protein